VAHDVVVEQDAVPAEQVARLGVTCRALFVLFIFASPAIVSLMPPSSFRRAMRMQ